MRRTVLRQCDMAPTASILHCCFMSFWSIFSSDWFAVTHVSWLLASMLDPKYGDATVTRQRIALIIHYGIPAHLTTLAAMSMNKHGTEMATQAQGQAQGDAEDATQQILTTLSHMLMKGSSHDIAYMVLSGVLPIFHQLLRYYFTRDRMLTETPPTPTPTPTPAPTLITSPVVFTSSADACVLLVLRTLYSCLVMGARDCVEIKYRSVHRHASIHGHAETTR